jgi:hypothetical protein
VSDVDEDRPQLRRGLFLTALVLMALDIGLLVWAAVMRFWSW